MRLSQWERATREEGIKRKSEIEVRDECSINRTAKKFNAVFLEYLLNLSSNLTSFWLTIAFYRNRMPINWFYFLFSLIKPHQTTASDYTKLLLLVSYYFDVTQSSFCTHGILLFETYKIVPVSLKKIYENKPNSTLEGK